MKLLLHVCCAPCSVFCIESLRKSGTEPVGFWYNPNIHPFTEYRARRDAMISYAEEVGMKLEVRDEYGLRPFVEAVTPHFDTRCAACYGMRMRGAAAFAREHGFEAFTTTLTVSPYQDHELIRAEAERAADLEGVNYIYYDFREGFRDGQARAREHGLYLQKYCGCIFSEEERYLKKRRTK